MNFTKDIDKYFNTRASDRPQLDLGISPAPFALPQNLRDADIGPTTLAELIIGFAQDEAARNGIGASRFTEALKIGKLTLQAFMFRTDGEQASLVDSRYFALDNQAAYLASLVAHRATLTVMAAEPNVTLHSITYRHDSKMIYTPFKSEIVDNESPWGDEYVFPENYDDTPIGDAGNIPDEFRAARSLGQIANTVLHELDRGSMVVRSDICSTMFGDLRGRGLM